MDLRTDPRLKPRLREALTAFGLDGPAAGSTVTRSDPLARQLEATAEQDAGFEGLYAALPADLPGDGEVKVSQTTETMQGLDGNDIELRIYRPVKADGPLPCVVSVHGGGMTILRAFRRRPPALVRGPGRPVCWSLVSTFATPGPLPAIARSRPGSTSAAARSRGSTRGASSSGSVRTCCRASPAAPTWVLPTGAQGQAGRAAGQPDGVYAIVPYVSGGYAGDRARPSSPYCLFR